MKIKILAGWACAGVGLLAMLLPSAQAGTVKVDWDVTTATCVVDTTPSGTISLADVDVSGLLGTSAPSFKTAGGVPFTVNISGCNGGITNAPGVRPVVKVTGGGGLVTIPGYGNQWLFKSGGDSEGVYIVLVKKNIKDGSDTQNVEVGEGTYLYVPGYGTDNVIPAGPPIPINLTAAVACGNPKKGTPAMCQKATTRAGDLRASFAFEFQYH